MDEPMLSHYTVGLKLKGKSDRVFVDAEDALIAALTRLHQRAKRLAQLQTPETP
jgi:hypothetical protein